MPREREGDRSFGSKPLPLSLTRKVNQSPSVSTVTCRIETFAIIADAQGEPVAISLDRHLQDGCIGVTNDVGEDFLEDAEDGQGRLGGKTGVPRESPAAATNSGARLEFLKLPVEGRCKSELFEYSGPQLSGDAGTVFMDRSIPRTIAATR
jgi:hypothetical protein